MRRRVLWGALLLAASASVAACSDNNDTPTNPTSTPTPVVETFSGTLTVNGGVTFNFNATQTGSVTATLTALEPDDAPVGISVGITSGTTCQVVLSNDNAGPNAQITGAVSTSSALCARVYDSAGRLEAPVTFTITVEHF